MSKRSKSLVGAAWAVLVMVALSFGATQAMAAPISACTGPGQIGSCPPFTEESCANACFIKFGGPGKCDEDDCCQCVI